MLRNFLKITLRNLLRNRVYTLINVLGLALSIACSLVLLLIIDFELSFDEYHSNRDRIFRITQHLLRNDGIQDYASAQYPMGEALRNDFPSMEQVAMTELSTSARIRVVQNDGESADFSNHEDIAFVEPALLKILDFQVLHGNLEAALTGFGSSVLTETRAMRYFSLPKDQLYQVIGQILVVNEKLNVTVDAIIKDLPSNTDFPFSMMVSFQSLKGMNQFFDANNWQTSSTDTNCYFLAPGDFDKVAFEKSLIPFINKYRGEGASELRKFKTQPLSEIHFDDRFSNYNGRLASEDKLWTMAAIALVLIITASINFINLATAQATKRSKEVGVRKIMGGSRGHLILQFFGENIILTISSMVFALVAAELMIIYFEEFIYLGDNFSLFTNSQLYKYLGILGSIVAILSGLYPAIIISGMKPLRIVGSSISTESPKGLNIRKVLIVSQFMITQVLIIGTLVIKSQMDYFNNKPLGFDSDEHITFQLPENSKEKLQFLQNELSSDPRIEGLTFTLGPPQTDSYFETHFGIMEEDESQENRTEIKPADDKFFDVFGLKFLAGAKYRANDTSSIVINRAMMEVQGFNDPQKIIGKKISIFGGKYPVCGVIENFHSRSLRESIKPMVITPYSEFYYAGVVRINQANTSSKELEEIMSSIETKWSIAFPKVTFEGIFVDDFLATRYEQEQKTASLFQVFTFVAIMIGILGLYGLVSFMAVQKTKEIGIRKVLGAGVGSIVTLFTSQFIRLMSIAFVLAAPIGYYLLSGWLEDYQNRITISIEHFIIAILISAAITLFAIGSKSIQAAIANPINSLRNE